MDSLIQIHAITNLLLIDTEISDDQRTNYQTELIAFEKKYLSKNVLLVRKVTTEKNKWFKRINDIQSEFKANEYQWWLDALEYERMNPSTLLRRIHEDILLLYNVVDAK